MLILTRKIGESVYIGDDVKVTIIEFKGNQARLGFDAPKHVRIYREEIRQQILEENQRAAAAALGDTSPTGSNAPAVGALKPRGLVPSGRVGGAVVTAPVVGDDDNGELDKKDQSGEVVVEQKRSRRES